MSSARIHTHLNEQRTGFRIAVFKDGAQVHEEPATFGQVINKRNRLNDRWSNEEGVSTVQAGAIPFPAEHNLARAK